MRDDNDDLPQAYRQPPINLDMMSIDELEGRIRGHEAEIERLRREITRKRAARGAADGFFKTS
jgi:uncharacterized small protein (DUF1192 family)